MLLTIKQVAELLGVSRSLVYRLVAEGLIPSHQIATCKRVHQDDLRDYVERGRVIDTKLPPGYRRHF